MNVLDIIMPYYYFVAVAVGVIGSLCIVCSDEIFKTDLVLTDKNEFVRCIFMYQFTVYMLVEDEINMAGIIILEVLTTLSVWFLNILILVIIVFLWIVKAICHLCWIIFRKSEGEE